MASHFSSVSTVRSLPGFLSSNYPVVSTSLTKFVYLEVVVLENGTKTFCGLYFK